MRRQKTLLLQIYLCFCLFISAPLVWAVGDYHDGSGEPNDPYQIITPAQLIELGEHPEDYDKHFVLMADLDFSVVGAFRKAVVAADTDPATGSFDGDAFAGVFDGNGHKITHLTINNPDHYFLGVFGNIVASGTIKNLGIQNNRINLVDEGVWYIGSLVGTNSGLIQNCYGNTEILFVNASSSQYVGGLVGENLGVIDSCSSSGSIEGRYYTGGLVGYNAGASIQYCMSSCTVTGHSNSAGGLIGECSGNTNVSYCYATGEVNSGNSYCGGIAGRNIGGSAGNAHINNCYSTGNVNGYQNVGGIVGYANNSVLQNCYSVSTVDGSYQTGPLAGSNSGQILKTYWSQETSGQSASSWGTKVTDAQLQQQMTFNEWDFVGIWDILEDKTYPFLRWQTESPVNQCKDGTDYPAGDLDLNCIVNLADFAIFAQNWMLDMRW